MKRFIILSFLMVILLWYFSWVFISHYSSTWIHRGQFGDMFGAVNALFSGLALAGIILTIYLQYKDLKAQGEVLKSQGELMQKQNELLDIQLRRENWLITPLIESKPGGLHKYLKVIEVWNHGERITHINIEIFDDSGELTVTPLQYSVLNKSEKFSLNVKTGGYFPEFYLTWFQ